MPRTQLLPPRPRHPTRGTAVRRKTVSMSDRDQHLPHTPQTLQEAEYWFPYHYVSQWSPRFSQCFYDSWGIHYISTIEFLLEKLSALPFYSIVDIGCGDGRMSRELAL